MLKDKSLLEDFDLVEQIEDNFAEILMGGNQLRWVKAKTGKTCIETCKVKNMTPVEVGGWEKNLEPFRVCAGIPDSRPGFQLEGYNATSCIVAYGRDKGYIDSPNHLCLCHQE